ncbi:uncharacterized protein LOC118738706 isoform X2 [Rhagoletis pomonella]|uniref:uncharacterized protein LOC118738706 isoform X2 n=1 Tax=Rhagoletis pomonella TaxID=28610 RepID=UPI001780E60B|nr:uncharacterized protein LOC118738706 isoform X2 [Rhagoletis pomonella]
MSINSNSKDNNLFGEAIQQGSWDALTKLYLQTNFWYNEEKRNEKSKHDLDRKTRYHIHRYGREQGSTQLLLANTNACTRFLFLIGVHYSYYIRYPIMLSGVRTDETFK